MRTYDDFLEGDYIEDVHGVIFDVKGFEHPPDRVVAYPRFVPDPSGDRISVRGRYRKIYDLGERMEFLKRELGEYLVYDDVFGRVVCEVPRLKVMRHYRPDETLRLMERSFYRASRLERDALSLARLLSRESGVSMRAFGVTGSLMVGLHRWDSDIDLVVYGFDSSWSVVKALARLFRKGVLSRRGEDELRRLYRERKVNQVMDFRAYALHEERKVQEGLFGERGFFIRFVKGRKADYHPYGYYKYLSIGRIRARLEIVDDSEAIFTPARYVASLVEVLNAELEEDLGERAEMWICSFRGRFCQQAFAGELVEVCGRVEKVVRMGRTVAYRVILEEDGRDYMISLSLLEDPGAYCRPFA